MSIPVPLFIILLVFAVIGLMSSGLAFVRALVEYEERKWALKELERQVEKLDLALRKLREIDPEASR